MTAAALNSRAYHHGKLRAALLDAGAALIRKHGLSALSLREAARLAGVSHAAPAHHFKSRTGFLTALATQGFERMVQRIQQESALIRASTGPQLLNAVGRGYITFALSEPERFSVMFRTEVLDESDKALTAAGDAAFACLQAAIGRSVLEGRLDRQRAESTALAAWSMVHGFATLWLGGRMSPKVSSPDPRKLAEGICAWFVDVSMKKPRS